METVSLAHSRRIAVCLEATRSGELQELLSGYSVEVIHIELNDPETFVKLSRCEYDAVVVSQTGPSAFLDSSSSWHVWLDFLNGVNLRSPVVLLGTLPHGADGKHYRLLECVPETEGYEGVVVRLRARGILQPEVTRKSKSRIGTLDQSVLLNRLKDRGALNILSINLTKFRKIATKFGNDAFEKVQTEVRSELLEMWGKSGNFRADDFLCQRQDDSLMFYVVLSQARGRDSLPAPGALERLGERVTRELLSRAWRAIGQSGKGFPEGLRVVPEIGTGHATVIYNPAVDGSDQIAQLLEMAQDLSRSQVVRVRERQRELLMSIIKSSDLIVPAYQAVFNLDQIDLNSDQKYFGLEQLSGAVFGFESLIRIRGAEFDQRMFGDLTGYLDAKTLRPDVLFELAHDNHLALELDQACLRHAVLGSCDLPGYLMANILPRNLYQIDVLRNFTTARNDIILEVSESEEVANYGKLGEVCRALRKMHVKIAADDFGKGFGGLDRILQMRPDIVKFDRSLIRRIDRDPARQAFLKSMVAAAKLAGSITLGEGVETMAEASVCQSVGLDLVQGFLFHKPQFKEEILDALGKAGKQKQVSNGRIIASGAA